MFLVFVVFLFLWWSVFSVMRMIIVIVVVRIVSVIIGVVFWFQWLVGGGFVGGGGVVVWVVFWFQWYMWVYFSSIGWLFGSSKIMSSFRPYWFVLFSSWFHISCVVLFAGHMPHMVSVGFRMPHP